MILDLGKKFIILLFVLLLMVGGGIFIVDQLLFSSLNTEDAAAEGEDWLSGYSYRKKISIDNTKVSGSTDLTNFPVLISLTDNDLRTLANGGNVENSNGYDLVFTSSDGSTVLDHEVESYTASTGAMIAWVRIPTLSYSSDTEIYIYYGNSLISSSQEDINGVWNSNYKMVQHLSDATTSTTTDSTSNGHDGTKYNDVTEVDGKINKAQEFDGDTDWITTNSSFALGTNLTSCFWAKPYASSTKEMVVHGQATSDAFEMYQTSDNNFVIRGGGLTGVYSGNNLVTNSWNFICGVISDTTANLYYNGAFSNTGTVNVPQNTSDYVGIGGYIDDGDYSFYGALDEVRISDAVLSADWIATEYNNQSSPSTFYSVGTEESSVPLSYFNYRKIITIDSDQVSGSSNLTNFPVLINLSSDSGLTAHAQTDGDDILFTLSSADWSSDNTSVKLSHEIESYDSATGELIAWVKIPSLAYASDTVLHMYYGHASVASQQDSENVWNSSYKMVQHMSDATTVTTTDSTSNGNDGSKRAADEPIENTTSQIYRAQEFDGTDDYIKVFDDDSLDIADDLTVSAWVYVLGDTGIDYQRILDKTSANTFWVENNGTIAVRIAASKGGTETQVRFERSLSEAEWHYLQFSYDKDATDGRLKYYEDGQMASSSDYYYNGMAVNTADLYIGNWSDGSRPFYGSIDDVRILNTILPADWIATEYNNQSSPSTFYSLSSEESTLASTPNAPNSLTQYQNDGTTSLGNQLFTSENTIKLQASATDANASEVLTLFFEVATSSEAFVSTSTPTSVDSCASGTAWDSCASKIWYVTSSSGSYSTTPYTGTVSLASLGEGAYKWQVKACDDGGDCSDWTAFNATIPNFQVDFTDPSLSLASTTNQGSVSTSTIQVDVDSSDSNNHSVMVDFNDSLVGWWRLEEGDGTSFVDSSSYGNDGSCSGDNCPSAVVGARGGAYDFDGYDDYINMPDDVSTDENLTISGRFKYDEQGETMAILGNWWNTFGQLKILSTGQLRWSWIDSSLVSHSINSNNILDVGEWYSFVISYNYLDQEGKLYVDGVLNNTVTAIDMSKGGWGNWMFFKIGASGENVDYNPYYFNGSIDDVMVFNRVLSAEEISALYNAGSTQYSNQFTGLSDGSYSFTAYAQDAAGNISTTSEATVFADTVVPTITYDVASTDDYAYLTGSDNLSVSLTTTDANQHYAFVDLDNSLVGYWRGENGARDESDQFLSLDGDGDYVESSANTIEGEEPFSLVGWFNPASRTGDFEGVLSIGSQGFSKRVAYIGRRSNGYLGGGFYASNELIWNAVPNLNEWYQIIMTYDGSYSRFYINGDLKDQDEVSGVDIAGNKTLIGSIVYTSVETPAYFVNGSIDNVMILDRTLSASEIAALYAKGRRYNGYSDDNLVAKWDFDGDVADSSGNSNDGTLYGDAQIAGTNDGTFYGDATTGTGKFGSGFVFDGDGDKVISNSNVTIYDDMTISMWLYNNDAGVSSAKYITSLGYNNVNSTMPIFQGDSGTYRSIWTKNGSNTNWDTNIITGSGWEHVTLTRNGNTLTFYINGSQVATDTSVGYGGYSITDNFELGYATLRAASGTYFNGSIDEVMVFDRALSADEIASLYNAQVTQFSEGYAGLSDGDHWFTGYTVDIAGNSAKTTARNFTVDSILPSLSYGSNTDTGYITINTAQVDLDSSDTNYHSAFLDFNDSLVSWWRMDDVSGSGEGSTVYDYTGTNNGTVYGDAYQISGGKYGKAFSFDGDGDYVDIGSDDSLNIANNQVSLSAWVRPNSLPASIGDAYEGIYDSVEDSYIIYADGFQDELRCKFTDADGTAERPGIASADLSTSAWQLVTCVYDGDAGTATIYLNGVQKDQHTSASLTGIVKADQAAAIGRNGTEDASYFAGLVDDIMIFNRALSTAEISALYNAGSTQYSNQFTGLSDGSYSFTAYAQDAAGNISTTSEATVFSDTVVPTITYDVASTDDYAYLTGSDNLSVSLTTTDTNQHYTFTDLDNSLVGYWRGENGARDESDQFLSLDGDGDYVEVSDSDSLDIVEKLSIGAWVKPNAVSGYSTSFRTILAKDTHNDGPPYELAWDSSAGEIECVFRNTDTDNRLTVSYDYNSQIGNWNYIVCTYEADVSGEAKIYANGVLLGEGDILNEIPIDDAPVRIGWDGYSSSDRYFNGAIDNVMILDRTLSASEVAALYAKGRRYNAYSDDNLVAKWDFDGDATDSSSNSNDGTFYGDAQIAGTNDGTFYGDATTGDGKFGSGFVFDGIDDRIDLGSNFSFNSDDVFTASGWIKLPDVSESFQYIFANLNSTGGIYLGVSSNLALFTLRNSSGDIFYSTKNISGQNDQWIFLTGVYDGENSHLFVDGTPTNDIEAVDLATGYSTTYIGYSQNNDKYLEGSIDEVMVFNRALSADEIASLYNAQVSQFNEGYAGLSDGDHWFTSYTVDIAGNSAKTTARNFTVDSILPSLSYGANTDTGYITINTTQVDLDSSDTNYHSAFVDFDDSLVSWWRMDDVSGTGEGSTVYDYTGNNNGTVYGDAYQISGGKYGKAFNFDGDGDIIRIGSGDDYFPLPVFSMCSWEKSSSIGSGAKAGIIGMTYGLGLYLNTSGYFTTLMDNGVSSDQVSVEENLFDNKWHHVCLAYDGTDRHMYVDGDNKLSTATTWLGTTRWETGAVIIGREINATTNIFNGSLDDVMIFNKALSDAEISALYNAGSTQYSNQFTGLSDGSYSFTAYVQDAAGNISTTSEATVFSDTVVPTITYDVASTDNYAYLTGSDNLSVSLTTTDANQHYAFTDLDNSLVGYWRGENGARDESDQFLSLDGDGDYVKTATTGLATTTFTASAWIKPAALDNLGYIVGHEWVSNWLLGINDNNFLFRYRDLEGDVQTVTINNFFTSTAWQLVTVSVNNVNNTLFVYLDGSLAYNGSISEIQDVSWSSSFIIGSYASDRYFFNGSIDDVLVLDRNLTPAEISDLYTKGRRYAGYSDDNLVAKWDFDGDATDSSGNNNDGTFYDDAQIAGTNDGTFNGDATTGAGKFGSGFVFDGDGDYVKVSDDDSLNFATSTFSTSMWFKSSDLNDSKSLITKGGTSNTSPGYRIRLDSANNGSIWVAASSGNGVNRPNCYLGSNYDDDQWHHLSAIFNRTLDEIDLYVDNSFVDSCDISIISGESFENTLPFFISYDGTQQMNGSIDEVMMFNRALSADEIASLYNAQVSQFSEGYAGLSDGNHWFTGYTVDIAGNSAKTTARNFTVDSILPSVSFGANTDTGYIGLSTAQVDIDSSDTNYHSAFVDFDDSLVSWWRMDDVSGSGEGSTVYDYTGTNNGTVYGDAYQISGGKYGKAFSFDGDGDYIDIGDVGIGETDSFSFVTWVNTVEGGTRHRIVADYATTFLGWLGNNRVAFMRKNDSGYQTTYSSGSLDLNTWYQVAGIYDGNTIYLYVNDSLESSKEIGAGDTTINHLMIGRDIADWEDYFNGSIDDVMLFNRALSAEEISALYNAQLTQYSSSITDLDDGTYSFTAYTQDAAGNVATTSSANVMVDLTAPDITYISPTPADASALANNFVEIKSTIQDVSLGAVTYSWNGSSTSLYDDNLVLMMNFDNVSALGESTSLVKDLSGNGNDGTVYGATYTDSGKYNGAYSFDGVDDYIIVNNASSINPASEISIEAWFKWNEGGVSWQSMISKSYDNSNQQYEFLLRDDVSQLRFAIGNGAEADYVPTSLERDTWSHVIGTFDGTRVYLYINGVLRNSKEVTITNPLADNGYNLTIGARRSDYGRFNGLIDEVKIYNKALSESEIQQLYMSNLRKYDTDKWELYVNQANLNDGTYSYYINSADSVGNASTSTSQSVIIDTSTPDITYVDAGASSTDRISLASDSWFNYNATGNDDLLSFSWIDPVSVSDDVFYYEFNTSVSDSISGDEATTTNAYLDTISVSEGTNYLHVRPKNQAGTWGTERSFVIKYDKTSPSGEEISSVVALSDTELAVTASLGSDDLSGLHSSPYWFNETSGNSGASDSSTWQGVSLFTDDGLASNTEYTYQVKLRDFAENETSYSTTVSAYTLASQVTGLSMSNGSDENNLRATLSWTDQGQSGIRIEQDTDCDGTYETVVYNNATSTPSSPYSAAGLDPNTCYQFRISSYNADGVLNTNSIPETAQITMPPANPSSVTGTAAASDSIVWDWEDIAGATSYNIYNGSDDSLLASVTASSTWTQTALSPNAEYEIYIRSSNANGEGLASLSYSAYTLADSPSLSLSVDSQNQITLTWTSSSNPVGTEYYAQNLTAGTNLDWASSTNSWISSNLACGTRYEFSVTARNAANVESSASTQTAVTEACPGVNLINLVQSSSANTSNITNENYKIIINNDEDATNKRKVKLSILAELDAINMAISNTADFSGISIESLAANKEWQLTDGDGEKTVYIKFYNSYGHVLATRSANITLDTIDPEINITNLAENYSVNENIVISGVTEARADLVLHWSDKYGLLSANGVGKWRADLGRLEIGSYDLGIVVTDLAGNQTETSINFNIVAASSSDSPSGDGSASEDQDSDIIKDILKPFVPDSWLDDEDDEEDKTTGEEAGEEEEKTEDIIIIPEEAPLALNGKWNLATPEVIEKFQLLPLSSSIQNLMDKFPELEDTFSKLGINKFSSYDSLKNVSFSLPSLGELTLKASGLAISSGLDSEGMNSGSVSTPNGLDSSGLNGSNLDSSSLANGSLSGTGLSGSSLANFGSLPLANLSAEVKAQIPSEFIFAKTSDEKIDFNVKLNINEEGEAEQRISAPRGEKLLLVIKPEAAVNSIKGYLLFRSSDQSLSSAQENNFWQDLFINEAKADSEFSADELENIEQRLVLEEFEYTDEDGDGLYTAEIETPLVEGEYEILSLIEYQDADKGTKAVNLITVVDPEGYVYEEQDGKEIRLPNVEVSIYELDKASGEYDLWPANDFQQENPQITDLTGKYSFLVPVGTYYIKAINNDYQDYQSEPFDVQTGSGVHFNIEMQARSDWRKMFSFQNILLIFIALMLVFNFYRNSDHFKKLIKRK